MKIPIKIRILLWYLKRQKGMKIYEMTASEARSSSSKLADGAEYFLDYAPVSLFQIFDQTITGRNGEIPIRIYQASKKEKLPVIMFFHGGGFVLRDIDSHDKLCRRIARDNETLVISVDYRLAPEYKFPTGVYDAYDATVWAAQHAEKYNGDASRLVVMGDSAGGNLATVVSMLARDQNGPKIAHQVLIYPCTDGTLSSPTVDQYGEGYFLTKKIMEWFIDHYKSREEDIIDPRMSPVFAEDFSNLPPAFIFTAEYDPLKGEAKVYADHLKNAGNKVIYKEYSGMIHGFLSMPKLSSRILDTYRDIQDILKKELDEEML
jgi:acetyl esterase/lipase